MGTNVVEGEWKKCHREVSNPIPGGATGIVMNIGNHSVMGQITSMASADGDSGANLKAEINRFVLTIAILALITGLILFIVWVAWLRTSKPVSFFVVVCT